MYLEHFNFKELPFTITPNVGFFYNLKGHQEAYNTVLFSLRSGEGFIKIVGEVGSGKTLLCRKLLDVLEKDYFTAYVPNPDLTPVELRLALAREIGVDQAHMHDQHQLINIIYDKLLSFHASGKKVVLLIDEAQALPRESLETLRLLTNLETQTIKLLQVVLFGQPELDKILNSQDFRQLKQRISFSYYLPLMNRDDLYGYLLHRLARAGHTYGSLFTSKAIRALYDSSKGVPRIVNILCHKALLAAYGNGKTKVDLRSMQLAIRDTEFAIQGTRKLLLSLIAVLSLTVVSILIFYIKQGLT